MITIVSCVLKTQSTQRVQQTFNHFLAKGVAFQAQNHIFKSPSAKKVSPGWHKEIKTMSNAKLLRHFMNITMRSKS
jgi:hypothetical protein